MGKLLILGNGFDLDLGWATRYSQFAESPEWDAMFKNSYLGRILDEAKHRNTWLDLEMELYRYASNRIKQVRMVSDSFIANDRKTYDELCVQLSQYLKRVTSLPIKKDSVAAKILYSLLKEGKLDCIYSFNYSPLEKVIYELGASRYGTPIVHVHGTIADDTLILGIHDTEEVDRRYNFMIKSYNEYFCSNRLSVELSKADEIVFFGLSMGPVDNLYFEYLFHYLQNEDIDITSKRNIRIVTYDMNGHRNILDNINKMNGFNAANLYQRTNFGFIHTSKGLKDRNLIEYLSHIAPKVENRTVDQAPKDNNISVFKSLKDFISDSMNVEEDD